MEARRSKLCWIILELKGIDASWREDCSAPPTAEELAVYQLLLLHVNSEFSLFHREKFWWKLNQNENKAEFIIKELRDWKNASICIEESDEDEHSEGLANTSNPLRLLIQLLEECRRSIDIEIQCGKTEEMATAGSPDATMTPTEADCCAEAMMEDELPEEARAGTLRNVLSYLEDMRRDRAYAPPKVDELEYYREIRKLITSTYMYFHAKCEWQASWQGPDWLERCSKPDSECCFAQVIPRICDGTWNTKHIETDGGKFRPPKGHAFEIVFDEMPDAESLLINCKRKLSDTIRELSSSEKIDWRGAVKCSYNTVEECNIKSVGGKHLRDKLLIIILKAFKRMKSLCSTTRPTYREVILFDRIAEHVESTVAVFYGLEASEESQPYRVNLFEAIPRILDKLDIKMGSRAAYLEINMLRVEAINSLYGGTPPTKHQMRIYGKICHQVRKARRRNYSEEQLHLSVDDLTIVREMLEIFHRREMNFFRGLMDEYKEMLHMIFTTVPRGFNADDTFKLLKDKKDNAVNELKLRVMASPQGPEVLERALLTLHEANAIHHELVAKFEIGDYEMHNMIREGKNCQVILKKLWTASQILQSPRVKQSLSHSKHRLNEVFEVSERSL